MTRVGTRLPGATTALKPGPPPLKNGVAVVSYRVGECEVNAGGEQEIEDDDKRDRERHCGGYEGQQPRFGVEEVRVV